VISLTKLSLAENILLFPASESLANDIPADDGKIANLFFQNNIPNGEVI